MNYTIRSLKSADRSTLWTMLMYAAHESSIDAVKTNPDLVRYVRGWKRAKDMGLVAEFNGLPVGAAWLRLWPKDDKGYGYLKSDIPELAIAVHPDYRAQDIGTALLKQLLEQAQSSYPAVSLSIRADNPALRLYQRIGFELVADTEVVNQTGGRSFTMVYPFDY